MSAIQLPYVYLRTLLKEDIRIERLDRIPLDRTPLDCIPIQSTIRSRITRLLNFLNFKSMMKFP